MYVDYIYFIHKLIQALRQSNFPQSKVTNVFVSPLKIQKIFFIKTNLQKKKLKMEAENIEKFQKTRTHSKIGKLLLSF